MLLIKMYIPPLKHCFIGETSVLTAYTLLSYMLYRVIRALLLKGTPKKAILFSLRFMHFDYDRICIHIRSYAY